jgi:rhamnosyltransferase subunit B
MAGEGSGYGSSGPASILRLASAVNGVHDARAMLPAHFRRRVSTMRNAHIVIATVGSQGDLFPFLAIGQTLLAHGHRVTLATHAIHQPAVTQAGLAFADASGIAEPDDRQAFTARAFDRWRGPRFVVHDFAALDVRASYEKLLPLIATADVLITTTLAFAGQILGEQGCESGELCWLSAVLAPAGLLSAYDPPATGIAALDHYIRRSPRRGRALQWMAKRITQPWTGPVRALRAELGLPAVSTLGDPFHQGQHAPHGVLALFSPLFGEPQPDWPRNVHLTGFARHVQAATLDAGLTAFLDAGPAPLVFTLGSTAVHMGEHFLRESLAAAIRLDQRAVLFTGSPEMRAKLPTALPSSIHVVDYASHALLFPHASAIIHHGGIGTSSEALFAGKPMLVVPHGFDQPDNAARLKRRGVAEVLPAARYRADRAVALLQKLQREPSYRKHAEACAGQMRNENAGENVARIIDALSRDPVAQARTTATRRTES